MGLKTETRIIGGVKVKTTQFSALRSFRLLSRLGKVLAPSLAKVAGVDFNSGVENMELSSFLPALTDLLGNLDPDEGQKLIRDLLAGSTAEVDGKLFPLDTDEQITLAFGGDLPALLSAARFALEVNYGDFFGAVRAAEGAHNDNPKE